MERARGSEGKGVVQKDVELEGLSTAILLPSAGLFLGRSNLAQEEVGALRKVAGLSLFQRAVLTLQRAGIRQLIVLAGAEAEALKHTLTKGARVTIPVRWMPIREFPLEDQRTWEALAAEIRGSCLVAGVEAVFSRGLIEHLRRSVEDGQAVIVARPQDREEPASRRRNPALQVNGDRLVAFHNQTGHETSQVAADCVVLPAQVLASGTQPAPATAVEGSSAPPIRRWLEQLAAEGRVRVWPVGGSREHWYCEVPDAVGAKQAERLLFRSLHLDTEGIVDRLINRKLSRLWTKVFLALRLSPNTITMVATVIGLIAAFVFGMGTYAAGLLAALLFQLSAVIDCSDGEVARLTFTESPFGAWLDIAMDNVVHIAIFAGIAAGAYWTMAGSDHAWVPLAFGAAAVTGNAVSFSLVNRAQAIRAAQRWRTPAHAAWCEFVLKKVASRDFSVVVFVFALIGKLLWFLALASVGSVLFALLMLWVVRPSAIAPHGRS